jgi:hypothetical protein
VNVLTSFLTNLHNVLILMFVLLSEYGSCCDCEKEQRMVIRFS